MDGRLTPLPSTRFSAGKSGGSDTLLCGHGAAAGMGRCFLPGPQPLVIGDFLLIITWLVPESGCGLLKCV